jgi:hypothetical protein
MFSYKPSKDKSGYQKDKRLKYVKALNALLFAFSSSGEAISLSTAHGMSLVSRCSPYGDL